MFSDLETAIRNHLADVIPGVPVRGTWDYADLSAEDAPRLAMAVEYRGFDALENKPGAVTLAQQFGVHLYVDAGKVRGTERTQAEGALVTIIERLLDWPDTRLRAAIQSSPVVQMAGTTLQMSIFFTLAPVVITP